MTFRRLAEIAAIVVVWIETGCGRVAGGTPLPASVWLLPSPQEEVSRPAVSAPTEIAPFEGELIVIDSSTFRLVQRSPLVPLPNGASRVALLTTFQGARYHPESIRALNEDPLAVSSFAGSVARAVNGTDNGIFIDFQGGTPDELVRTTAMLREIADSARAIGLSPVGVIVPPGDTIGYPTKILARSADVIVVRLSGEHRAGTAPGPLVSPEWMARQIGIRAYDIGVARLVAEFPLYGHRWNRDGTVRSITYVEAQALVRSEAGVFRRDPASGSLVASSARNGWTVWIQDAETLARLVGVARHAGVRQFALLGVSGADPDIWTRLPAALKR